MASCALKVFITWCYCSYEPEILYKYFIKDNTTDISNLPIPFINELNTSKNHNSYFDAHTEGKRVDKLSVFDVFLIPIGTPVP
jgi:hypothetical protein